MSPCEYSSWKCLMEILVAAIPAGQKLHHCRDQRRSTSWRDALGMFLISWSWFCEALRLMKVMMNLPCLQDLGTERHSLRVDTILTWVMTCLTSTVLRWVHCRSWAWCCLREVGLPVGPRGMPPKAVAGHVSCFCRKQVFRTTHSQLLKVKLFINVYIICIYIYIYICNIYIYIYDIYISCAKLRPRQSGRFPTLSRCCCGSSPQAMDRQQQRVISAVQGPGAPKPKCRASFYLEV